jgi:mRNA-degrading endonuclease toxin of MazEF toxin-antitoxin module
LKSPYLVTDEGFPETKLIRSSVIKCEAIFAYPKSRIKKRLGKLPIPLLEQVRQKIGEILAIGPSFSRFAK